MQNQDRNQESTTIDNQDVKSSMQSSPIDIYSKAMQPVIQSSVDMDNQVSNQYE